MLWVIGARFKRMAKGFFGVRSSLETMPIGGIGLQLTLAAARAATMALYTVAMGGATVGTEYVVWESGRFVLTQTKPGVVATIRTYNRAAAASANQAAVNMTTTGANSVYTGISNQVQGIAQASGLARTQVANELEAIAAQIAHLPTDTHNIISALITRAMDPAVNSNGSGEPEEKAEVQASIHVDELDDKHVEIRLSNKSHNREGVDSVLPQPVVFLGNGT
jgi:hypothetical protein